MKTYGWLLLLFFAVTLVMGCSHNPCKECMRLEANCCGWEFYKPCDLIEGKRDCCDRDLCDRTPPPCDEPVVVHVEEAVPADAPMEAPEAPPMEAPAPAAPAAPEGGAPVADYGFPPVR